MSPLHPLCSSLRHSEMTCTVWQLKATHATCSLPGSLGPRQRDVTRRAKHKEDDQVRDTLGLQLRYDVVSHQEMPRARWLLTRKGFLCQLPSLDGKRLLCQCSKSSPCHVDVLIAVWRSHRLPMSSRVRSTWQVYVDNVDVLEVRVTGQICKSSPSRVNMRVLSLRVRGSAGRPNWWFSVSGRPTCCICSGTDPFHVGHIEFLSSGQKVDANPGRSLGRCFPIQARMHELFQ